MYCHGTVEKQTQLRLINDLENMESVQDAEKKIMYKMFNLRTRLNMHIQKAKMLPYCTYLQTIG